MYRVRVLGEFSKGESESIIPLEYVETTVNTKVSIKDCFINKVKIKVDDEHYLDKSAKMWGNMRDILEENFTNFVQGKEPSIELTENEKLIKQLSNRKYRINSKGKIGLEKKEQMRISGGAAISTYQLDSSSGKIMN